MDEVNPPEVFAILLVIGELWERNGTPLQYNLAERVLTQEINGVPMYDADACRLLDAAVDVGLFELHSVGARQVLTCPHLVQILPPSKTAEAPKARVIDAEDVTAQVLEECPDCPTEYVARILEDYRQNDWHDGYGNKIRGARAAANKIKNRWKNDSTREQSKADDKSRLADRKRKLKEMAS
jgi:hypothetical protein